jgi:hypothetical protein
MDPNELEALATSVLGPQPETDEFGTVRWYWRGQLHREDGPASEYVNGSKGWWRNGKRHRDDGPAVEYANGDKEWWRNGEPHRDDGPAIEHVDGYKAWYRNGQRHRDDGPAVEYADGYKAWWRNGVQVKPFTESLDPEELEAIVFSIPPKWEFRWEDETHRNIGIYFQGKGVGKYFIERKPTDAETVKRSIETTFKKYDEIMPYEYGANWMNVWDWYWRIKNSLDAKR